MATNKPVEIDELFGELTPSNENEKWTVVYTKPKREKKLAEYAQQREITYYLPLQDSIRHYKYRKIKFTKPLFPGYLFVKCSFEQQQTLIKSGHIMTFLKVKHEETFLDELKFIHQGREAGADFEEHSYVEIGHYVEITEGTLKGLRGYVEDIEDASQIILQIDILKRAVSVKVKPNHVRFISQ